MTTYRQRTHPEAAEGEAGRARWAPNPARPIVVGHFLGTVVVTLHGDLDLAGAVGLAGVLRDVIDSRGELAVVVDLGDVGRIERCGVDVLASAAGRIAASGGRLQVGGPAGAVFDALALGGLGRLVGVSFEQAPRPRPARRRDDIAWRRAAVDARSSGAHRSHPTTKGDAS